MTVINRDKKLTPLRARRLKKRLGVERLSCFRCGRTIRLGSRVNVHNNCLSQGGSSVKIYHKACWDSLFISC
jgi:hypothetical protein